MVSAHEGANKELDAMEARIALRGSDPETLRVRQNLQILGSWRHRQVQDGPLPATERTRLLTDFRMSDEERKPWEERASAIADGVVGYLPKS